MLEQQRPDARQILSLIPQQPPFRFIDEVLEVAEDHVVTAYTFRGSEPFYQGHFPGYPVTPGVLIIEAMCQTLVVLGIGTLWGKVTPEEMKTNGIVVCDCQADFLKILPPDNRITLHCRKIFFRMKKIRAQVDVFDQSGDKIAEGVVSGMMFKIEK
jgi:3-hydroxyacyl-[acyl-carrier-protein] dehydratase